MFCDALTLAAVADELRAELVGGRIQQTLAVDPARFSAARQSNNVPVDYTVRRNVHRRKGGRPGQVTYRGQRTIIVQPCEA